MALCNSWSNELIDNKIEPEDKTYKIYLEESIKCHHNDIANYFIDNFFDKNDECAEEFGFHYRNYNYMPKNINNQRSFCLLCKYDYFSFVELFLKIEASMLNATAIFKKKNSNKVQIKFLNEILKSQKF